MRGCVREDPGVLLGFQPHMDADLVHHRVPEHIRREAERQVGSEALMDRAQQQAPGRFGLRAEHTAPGRDVRRGPHAAMVEAPVPTRDRVQEGLVVDRPQGLRQLLGAGVCGYRQVDHHGRGPCSGAAAQRVDVPQLRQLTTAEGADEVTVPDDIVLAALFAAAEDERVGEAVGTADAGTVKCRGNRRPAIEVRAVTGRLVADLAYRPTSSVTGEADLPGGQHLQARCAGNVLTSTGS